MTYKHRITPNHSAKLAPKKYYIYSRKSRPDTRLEVDERGVIREVKLTVEETLARHKEALLVLADSMNTPIAGIFEEVVSGETIASRPEVNKLLDLVATGEVAGVFVYNITRLARGEARDQGDILEIFKYSSTKIITPRKIYDPNDPADYKYLEFEFFMAHQEWGMIRERMEEGRFADVTEGQYIGSVPPMGYDKVRKGGIKTLESNEYAETIYEMFRWGFEEDLTVSQIQLRLNKEDKPHQSGGKEWSYQYVDRIMRNPVYIGKVRWGYQPVERVLDPDTRRMVKKRGFNPTDYLTFDGLHAAIVPEEWFYSFQEKHPKKPPARRDYAVQNILAGLMRCRECGKRIKREVVKRPYGSYPRFSHVPSKECKCKSARYDDVIYLVKEALKEKIRRFEVELKAGDNSKEIEEYKKKLASKEKELDAIARAKTSLWDRFDGLKDMLPVEEFKGRMAYLLDKEEALIRERNALMESEPTPVDFAGKIVAIQKAIDMIDDESVAPEDANNALRSFIDYIEYWNEGGYGESNIYLDVHLR